MWKIAKPELGRLIDQLREQGYTVIGPTVADNAMVMAEIETLADLPQGYVDTQQPGQYRVSHTGHPNYFQFNVGPHSWKQYLFPPRMPVSTAERGAEGWTFKSHDQPQPKYAFLGVRACELAAIEVQDRVFLHGPYVDPVYKARRESALLIAVNCTVAASTCFCTSMNTGPKCREPYDMALTEIDDGFMVEVGSARGEALLNSLQATVATEPECAAAHQFQQRAADQISKRLDTTNIRQLLLDNLEHPRWDEVAQRCLSCTNCTQVCPTCFCSSVTEVADLTGDKVVRQREWDSCFNIDFSYMSGGVVRDDRRSRYRQWLTHKLASWHDQFETSGCVGCGRCITWCPVGIDLTEEVSAIRNVAGTQRRLPVVGEAKTVCVVPQESSE